MPKSLVIIFKTLPFFMSSWLGIIQTVSQWLPHTTCFTCLILMSVLLIEGLPLLTTLFELLIPLKNKCAWHSVTFIHLLKHFKCLWWCFFQLDQIFRCIYCSVFVVCSSVLIAEQPEKEEMYTKACGKNVIVAESWDFSYCQKYHVRW